VLDHPLVQARLHLPPDGQQRRPESQMTRSLYDCPNVPVGPEGVRYRVVVATHPAGKTKSRVGLTRQGVVYELFFTSLPQQSFTVVDVVELYLHRGAFEPALSDEDDELDPDRWCSHAACGQECWQLIAQWVWNLRLELGHVLAPQPLRTTEFAPALPAEAAERTGVGYSEPASATSWKAGRFTGSDFAFQPDGSLRCPAGKSLWCGERRSEADGSLRLVYEARIADCRACSLREQCQWHGHQAKHPRRVSLRLASSPRWLGSAALARLAAPGTSTRPPAAPASSTRRGPPSTCSGKACSSPACCPLAGAASPLSAFQWRASHSPRSPCSASQITSLLSWDCGRRKRVWVLWCFLLLDPESRAECSLMATYSDGSAVLLISCLFHFLFR
jgi:hypothetical protein